MNLEPEQLIQLARAGNGSRLGRLLESYRNYLKLLARLRIGRKLQTKLDSSDLIQETFAEAVRDFPQFHGTTEEELVAWLRRILANNLAGQVRHYYGTRRRDLRLEERLADELAESSRAFHLGILPARDSGDTPSKNAVRREEAVLLADALEQLTADYREVIILRHLERLKFQDVAKRMGRSVDAVEKLWARALAELRTILRELP